MMPERTFKNYTHKEILAMPDGPDKEALLGEERLAAAVKDGSFWLEIWKAAKPSIERDRRRYSRTGTGQVRY
jgi:hypothetical protein